jgi:hypothetical protein
MALRPEAPPAGSPNFEQGNYGQEQQQLPAQNEWYQEEQGYNQQQ